MLRRLLLAGSLTVAGLIGAGASLAPPASAFSVAWYTNCEQSHFYGSRVCADASDRTIYVFYGPQGDTVPDVAFSTNSIAYAGQPWVNQYHGPIGVFPPGEQYWDISYPGSVTNWDATPPDYVGTHMIFYNLDGCHDGTNRFCIGGGPNGNFRFISWYANTPGYEFVISQ